MLKLFLCCLSLSILTCCKMYSNDAAPIARERPTRDHPNIEKDKDHTKGYPGKGIKHWTEVEKYNPYTKKGNV